MVNERLMTRDNEKLRDELLLKDNSFTEEVKEDTTPKSFANFNYKS